MLKLRYISGFGVLLMLLSVMPTALAVEPDLNRAIPSDWNFRFEANNVWVFSMNMVTEGVFQGSPGEEPADFSVIYPEYLVYELYDLKSIANTDTTGTLTFDYYENNVETPDFSDLSDPSALTDFDLIEADNVANMEETYIGMMESQSFFPDDVSPSDLLTVEFVDYIWSVSPLYTLWGEEGPDFTSISGTQTTVYSLADSLTGSIIYIDTEIETPDFPNAYEGSYEYLWHFSGFLNDAPFGESETFDINANFTIGMTASLELDYNHVMNNTVSEFVFIMDISLRNEDGTDGDVFQQVEYMLTTTIDKEAETTPPPAIPEDELNPTTSGTTTTTTEEEPWYNSSVFYWTLGGVVIATGGLIAAYFGLQAYTKPKCDAPNFDTDHPNLFKQFCAK